MLKRFIYDKGYTLKPVTIDVVHYGHIFSNRQSILFKNHNNPSTLKYSIKYDVCSDFKARLSIQLRCPNNNDQIYDGYLIDDTFYHLDQSSYHLKILDFTINLLDDMVGFHNDYTSELRLYVNDFDNVIVEWGDIKRYVYDIHIYNKYILDHNLFDVFKEQGLLTIIRDNQS